MKITIAFLPEEQQEAAASVAALRELYPAAKVRRSTAHPPHEHIYLNIPQPKKTCK